ncbi:MAG: flagellar hook-basal body complex protein FliE [Limnobacter sp.]|uniref:flagellar hook-basal body complex protein FliE n=1 Tax=Limnobacter sp. TaxID=2003368 RepID=UPI0039193860
MINSLNAVTGVLSSAVTDALQGATKAAPAQGAGKASFADAIAQALKSASDASDKSADLNRRLQMDDPSVSVEETVIAMNTSSLQFTGIVQARNKVLQAYNDIMNMPV